MRRIFLCLFLCAVFLNLAAGQSISASVGGGSIANDGSTVKDGSDINDSVLTFTAKDEVKLPVVMYHLVTKKGAYIGKYGITPEALESDLKFLKDNGYGTVVMKDVRDFVTGGGSLPDKPVMLTFDDGNFGDYQYLFPLLQKYQMKAIVSVVGKYTDDCTAGIAKNPGAIYPNMTWTQIKEMADSGLAEIQSHSYNLHGGGGAGRRGGEDMGAYQARLRADLERLQELCKKEANVTPDTFTYPLGVISGGSEEVLRGMGFVSSFSCTEGINTVKRGEPDRLFLLKRCIRPTGKSVQDILSGLKTD